MTDREILKNILVRAGLGDQIESIADTDELPDTILASVSKALMTESDAKSNPSIKNHHLENFVRSHDEELVKSLKKAGISKDEIDSIIWDKSKNPNLVDRQRAAVELLKAKASEYGNEDVQKLAKQVEAEREKYNQLEQEANLRVESVRNEFVQKETNLLIHNSANSFNWSHNYDSDERIPLYQARLQQKLAEVNGELRNENGVLVVRDKNNPELIAQVNNKNITFGDLHQAIESKYMAVSSQSDAPVQFTQKVVDSSTGANSSNSSFQKALSGALAGQGL